MSKIEEFQDEFDDIKYDNCKLKDNGTIDFEINGDKQLLQFTPENQKTITAKRKELLKVATTIDIKKADYSKLSAEELAFFKEMLLNTEVYEASCHIFDGIPPQSEIETLIQ